MLLSITAGPDVVGYGRMFNCGKDEYLELDPAAPLVFKKNSNDLFGNFPDNRQ